MAGSVGVTATKINHLLGRRVLRIALDAKKCYISNQIDEINFLILQ